MKKGDKVIIFHDKSYGHRGDADRQEQAEIISIGKKWITVTVNKNYRRKMIFDAQMNNVWFFHGEKEYNHPYLFQNEEYLKKYLHKRDNKN